MAWKSRQDVKTLFLAVIAALLVGSSAAINVFVDSGFVNYTALLGGLILLIIAIVLIVLRGKIFPEK